MKKKWYIYFSVFSMLSLGSCSSEDSDVEGGQLSKVTLTAGINTRTTLNNGSVRWSAGDLINVNGSTSEGAQIFNSGSSATFTVVAAPPYSAVYPSSVVQSYSTLTDNFNLRLSNIQKYKDELSFSDGENISVAKGIGTSSSLTFNNVFGILKVALSATSDIPDVTSANLILARTEFMSGNFSLSPSVLTLVPGAWDNVEVRNEKKIEFPAPLTISSSSTRTLYFVLPPKKYASGWRIVLYDKFGVTLASFASVAEIDIVRSRITSVTAPVSVPSTPVETDPRIYVSGSGDDAKLLFTKEYSNYGTLFQYGGVVAWNYYNGGSGVTTTVPNFNPTETPNFKFDDNWRSPMNINYCKDTPVSEQISKMLNSGIGDPCRLVGFTAKFVRDELRAGRLPDNGKWRLPTRAEAIALLGGSPDFFLAGNTTVNGVRGFYLPKNSNASTGTFFPHTGFRNLGGTYSTDLNTKGHYWLGEASGSFNAFILYLTSNYAGCRDGDQLNMNMGASVRCVQNKNP